MKKIKNFEQFNEGFVNKTKEYLGDIFGEPTIDFIEPFQEKLETLENDLNGYFKCQIRIKGTPHEIYIKIDSDEDDARITYNIDTQKSSVKGSIDLNIYHNILDYIKNFFE